MSRAKQTPTTTRKLSPYERVAPDILALPADSVPRTKAAIVKSLAGRHAEDDVALALVRLAVTERVVETGGKYTLAQEAAPDAG